MNKKIFVLLVTIILIGALTALFIYDKNALKQEQYNNEIIEKEERITEDDIRLEDVTPDRGNIDFEDDILGSLIIDKINLNAIVKEGSSNEVLKDYIGHIEETAKYDGNVGLAAHNRGNEHSYFARINELELGDEIIYQTRFGERIYKVINKEEILETDWNLLGNTKENKLTLITCIRNKVNQRLCVQAIQQET